MPETFRCTVVTPEEQVLDEEVTYVSLPAWDGLMGIAPGRAPVVSRLGVGTMRLDFPGDASRWILIEGGFMQMVGDRLTVLSDRSIPAERLIASDAAKELEQVVSARTGPTDEEHAAKERAMQAAREKRRLAELSAQRGI